MPSPLLAIDEPRVPEQVAAYFASGLVPRLADLYGPGAKVGSGVIFDETTKVGTVRRVLAWTKTFLSGTSTVTPTELTNNWVAPVTTRDGVVLGLATVWVNPASDLPELADFDKGSATVAPKGALLVRDDVRHAWFASDGTTITPLVAGDSGARTAVSNAGFQKLIAANADAPQVQAPSNQGLLVAGVVLGIVVVLLAGFVLLPDRRKKTRETPPAGEDAASAPVEPGEEPAVAATVRPATPARAAGSRPATAKPAAKAQRPPGAAEAG